MSNITETCDSAKVSDQGRLRGNMSSKEQLQNPYVVLRCMSKPVRILADVNVLGNSDIPKTDQRRTLRECSRSFSTAYWSTPKPHDQVGRKGIDAAAGVEAGDVRISSRV